MSQKLTADTKKNQLIDQIKNSLVIKNSESDFINFLINGLVQLKREKYQSFILLKEYSNAYFWELI